MKLHIVDELVCSHGRPLTCPHTQKFCDLNCARLTFERSQQHGQGLHVLCCGRFIGNLPGEERYESEMDRVWGNRAGYLKDPREVFETKEGEK